MLTEDRIYDTKKEVIEEISKAVAEKCRHLLTSEWHEPYSDKDIEELHELLFGGDRSGKKKSSQRKQIRKQRLPTLSEPSHLSNIYKYFGIAVRKSLGLHKPLPLAKLEEELKKIELTIEGEWIDVWYPCRDWVENAHEGLHIWEIDSIRFPKITAETIAWGGKPGTSKIKIEDAIDSIVEWMHCHPAQALVFLLCDIPPDRSAVTVIIGPFFRRLALYVRDINVPVYLTSIMYKNARLIQLFLQGKKATGVPKPRDISRRVSTLGEFVQHNKGLNWGKLLEKWNNDYPTWRYKTGESMRIVYNRVKPPSYSS